MTLCAINLGSLNPDWVMVVITFVYVIATIIICVSNHKSAKAAIAAVEESKKQFQQNEKQIEQSKKQFEQSIELQKQHNYDSVRPAVSIDFTSRDDGDTFSGSIAITNHGLGPAIIKELIFRKNREEYKNTNGYCTLIDLVSFRSAEENEKLTLQDIFNQFKYYSKEFRNASDNRDYLAVGEKLILFEFETDNTQNGELVGRIFHGVHMELIYTDIYSSGEWRVCNRLSYFKPNWIDKRKVKRSNSE